MRDLNRWVEALLFAADRPITIEQMQECVPEATSGEIEAALVELQAFYDTSDRAFLLAAQPGGWQVVTRPSVAPWVEKLLVGRRRQRLSRAALEVLAIVAYRQPLTRGEIEAVRGVDCGAVLHTLLDRKLVAIKGRARTVGHPLVYATTDRFLEHFGISAIRELPKLEEFASLVDAGAARAELEQAGLLPLPPADDGAAVAETAAETETDGAGAADSAMERAGP